MSSASFPSFATFAKWISMFILLVVLSGCHLRGDWIVSQKDTDHLHSGGEPQHLAVDGTFVLGSCADGHEGYYCFTDVNDSLKPRSAWESTELTHPTEEQIRAMNSLVPRLKTEDVCLDHCAIGDFKVSTTENHVMLLDEVHSEKCTSSTSTNNERCFQILLFCADRQCRGGVDELPNKNVFKVQHIGSGHAHKH